MEGLKTTARNALGGQVISNTQNLIKSGKNALDINSFIQTMKYAMDDEDKAFNIYVNSIDNALRKWSFALFENEQIFATTFSPMHSPETQDQAPHDESTAIQKEIDKWQEIKRRCESTHGKVQALAEARLEKDESSDSARLI